MVSKVTKNSKGIHTVVRENTCALPILALLAIGAVAEWVLAFGVNWARTPTHAHTTWPSERTHA